MERPFVFVASGWPPEAEFHAAIASALAREGKPSIAVVLGDRYAKQYRESGAFEDVYDLVEWSRTHWEEDLQKVRSALETAEQAYGFPNYWTYLAADRFLCRKDFPFNLRTALAQTTFWEEFYSKHSPALITGEVSHFHNYLSWAIGHANEVPFAHLIPARVPKCCAAGDGPFEHRNLVEASYRAYQQTPPSPEVLAKAKAYIDAFQDRTGRASHLQEVKGWMSSPVGTGSLSAFLADIPRYVSEERQFNYTLTPPWEKLRIWALQRARKASMTAAGIFTPVGKLPDEEPFVLFGLHLQPESSTLVRGQYFQDMVAVARNAASSLPAGYRLFVKEHDVMFGRRPRSFYEDLANIANVELVSPYESGPQLVRKASAVLAVTGTLGWDGILLGIPAVVLGEPFFNSYDGAEHVTDMTTLPQVFKKVLHAPRHDADDQVNFVAAVLDNVLEANMDDLWGLRESNYDQDADVIAQELLSRCADPAAG